MDGNLSKEVIFFQKQFAHIMSIGDITDEDRDFKLSDLMTKMEKTFKVPYLNNEEYNWENPQVISLYRKIAKARITL